MRVPHLRETVDVDVAVIGIPTDDAVSFRSGARFGPEAIRSASALLRNFNPLLGVNVAERLSIVDWGDAPTVPGYVVESLDRTRHAVEGVARAGIVTLCLGGDHTVLLAELRALAAVHGPLGLIQLDAHHDLWDEYFGQKIFHGSIVRRAVEEGLIDPARSIQAGMRGSLYDTDDMTMPANIGIDGLSYEELAALGPAGFSTRARERVGNGPCFLSFDIDFVDPAFAPGTGTPEVGGPTSREALTFLRSLAGLDFRGFDCVEVSPSAEDSWPGITALLAANVGFEMLSMLASLAEGSSPNP